MSNIFSLKPRVYIKTFGCRSNLYDTQVMISNLKDYEITEDEMNAEIIIINSCTVTNKADREVRSYARKFSSLGKKVFLTGCGVKNIGADLYKQNLAFGVFSHSHKEDVNEILKKSNEKREFLKKEKISKHIDTTILPKVVGKIRAFIKIQEGCNFACSYCIIPSVRGMARSFREENILNQVSLLADNGISEVILTGTNIGSYGLDTNRHIADLIHKISKIQNIKRIRLGSLEPSQIDSKFLNLLNNEKLEKHLHIALQHTSPKMLEIMNRKNTFPNDLALFNHISSYGYAIGTDYIIGHHGESEDIFLEALHNLEKLPLTHIHPFIYSPRTGTKSSVNEEKLEIIKGNISKIRLKKIQDIVKFKNIDFRKKNKKELNILLDTYKMIDNNLHISGLDEYFNRIYINSKNLKKGEWTKIDDYVVLKDYNLSDY